METSLPCVAFTYRLFSLKRANLPSVLISLAEPATKYYIPARLRHLSGTIITVTQLGGTQYPAECFSCREIDGRTWTARLWKGFVLKISNVDAKFEVSKYNLRTQRCSWPAKYKKTFLLLSRTRGQKRAYSRRRDVSMRSWVSTGICIVCPHMLFRKHYNLKKSESMHKFHKRTILLIFVLRSCLCS